MSRTLEEILAYSRETGTDWALTAEEAGLLRREVERLRGRITQTQIADAVLIAEAKRQLTSERERGAKAVRDEREAAAADKIERGEHRK